MAIEIAGFVIAEEERKRLHRESLTDQLDYRFIQSIDRSCSSHGRRKIQRWNRRRVPLLVAAGGAMSRHRCLPRLAWTNTKAGKDFHCDQSCRKAIIGSTWVVRRAGR